MALYKKNFPKKKIKTFIQKKINAQSCLERDKNCKQSIMHGRHCFLHDGTLRNSHCCIDIVISVRFSEYDLPLIILPFSSMMAIQQRWRTFTMKKIAVVIPTIIMTKNN